MAIHSTNQTSSEQQFLAEVDDPALVRPRVWYAAYTRSHHEKSVERQLTGKGIQCFLPLYQTVREWSHYRKAKLDLPLFPNYLFVHISRQEQSQILGSFGLIGLVGPGNKPQPLLDREIEGLRAGLENRGFEPHPFLTVGQKARIVSGPLAGMEGVVIRTKGSLRVVLSVNLIKQSVAVDISADEIQPIASAHLN